MTRPRILIADDTADSLTLLSEVLEPQGYEILAVSSGHDALKVAERARPDLVLLDVMMPGHDGFHVCRTLKAEEGTRDIPVIFITSRNDLSSVLNGFRMGGLDYIFKPFQPEEVVTRVATHLKISLLTRHLQQRNAELELEVGRRMQAEQARDKATQRLSTFTSREASRWGLEGFVGGSGQMRKIVAEIERLRNFPKTSVLVLGESGTGKELVARALHYQSARAEGPFVPVNCVAVPSDLLESLFFGHMKGSFTGATTDRKGYFEMADGGTLFLDEIGDMPAALQAKLLRVLEDGEVTPVGATKARQVNVRVVSATNANLKTKIANGLFREDLYYRLARYTIHTPPLRERREDLPELAAHFLTGFAAEMGTPAPALDQQALDMLRRHTFPGNIRELKNVLERAIILSGGKTVKSSHLQLLGAPVPTETFTALVADKAPQETSSLNLEAAEHTLILRALEQTGGNVTKAARLLNVNRSRIYRRMPGAL